MAAAAIVTFFSALMLVGAFFQSCVVIYRQEHAHLDLILDSIGLALLSWFVALMTGVVSRIWNAATSDGPLRWAFFDERIRIAFGLLLLAVANLVIAVFTCNRYATIWSYCHALVDSS